MLLASSSVLLASSSVSLASSSVSLASSSVLLASSSVSLASSLMSLICSPLFSLDAYCLLAMLDSLRSLSHRPSVGKSFFN